MTLVDDIRELLAAPDPADPRPFLDRLDATLTTGYAQALQLEAERWRIERRIGAVASGAAERGDDVDTDELAELARRLTTANDEISMLRSLLVALRDRRSCVRRAA